MEQAPSSNTTGLVWIQSPALVRHQESYLEWVVVGGRCEGKGIGQEVLNVPSAWLGDQYKANWEPVPLKAGGVRAVLPGEKPFWTAVKSSCDCENAEWLIVRNPGRGCCQDESKDGGILPYAPRMEMLGG